MSDLFKAFEKFLFRDISFVLGGSVLLGSVMYVFDKLPICKASAIEYFIWAGVFYTIGYSVQEVFTLLHLVRTKASFPPNYLGRLLYRLFDRKWPESIKEIEYETEYEKAKQCLYQEKVHERFRNDHERIESLKQIGTSLGPCFLLAGFILFSKKNFYPTEFGYVVSGGLVALGLILILLGWLKVTQQSEYLIKKFNKVKSPDTTPTASLAVTDNSKIDFLDSKEKTNP